jgi:hypothetical protein
MVLLRCWERSLLCVREVSVPVKGEEGTRSPPRVNTNFAPTPPVVPPLARVLVRRSRAA